MSEPGARVISFAGSAVEIRYSGATGRRIVEFLYRDVPEKAEVEPHVHFLIDGVDDQVRLLRGEEVLYEGDSPGRLANLLLGESIYHLADRSSGGGVLHAGALSHRGRGLIIPGRSGAGKTTATAWLVRNGFDYLTDELVFIPEGTRRLLTFTRPLNVKTHGKGALAPHFDFEEHAEDLLVSPHATLIPLRLINSENRIQQPDLELIIFIQYRKDAGMKAERLSKAQGGMRLMECLVNARNLPGHGFTDMARLARQVPAWSVEYSDLEALRDTVLELLDQPEGASPAASA